MKLTSQKSNLKTTKADAIALFVAEDKKIFQESLHGLRKFFGKKIDQVIKLEHFEGKEDSIISILTERKLRAPRLFLIGIGEAKKLSFEKFRRASALAAKQARTLKIKHLAFAMPDTLAGKDGFSASPHEIAQAMGEGAYLSLYKFDKYFTEKKNKAEKVREITLFDPRDETVKAIKKGLNEARILCEATCFARDLENAPSNEIYPESLAAAAKLTAEKHGFNVSVWDKKRIEKESFGGLLAVNAGSTNPPRFIILELNAGRNKLDTIVLVGKGITFDTGGISIKPSSGMAEMKMDMSGAAAVIGTIEAAARLKLPFHLVGLIPATENMPGGSAMKPGDIIKHYGDKTSEVDNTDAEGRLILADALAYATKYKPKAVIDLATLTGACVVALGQHATGMMGNDDSLMSQLKAAGEKTYERVWQLPIYEEYEKQIKSDVADVKNVGGKWAGAITAALFLKKFIGDYKWVHLDIAGTAILEEDLPYAPKGGSGVGVRLLIEFLKNWKQQKPS
jgi:leucyl aminopeptidase